MKLSFYPNNYLSFIEACKHVDKVIEQTKANDHFIDEHEDSFIINLADDSSTDESCDDYDSSTETANEGEWNDVFSVFCKLFSVCYRMKYNIWKKKLWK